MEENLNACTIVILKYRSTLFFSRLDLDGVYPTGTVLSLLHAQKEQDLTKHPMRLFNLPEDFFLNLLQIYALLLRQV